MIRFSTAQSSQNLTPAFVLQNKGSSSYPISWVSRAAEPNPPKNRNVGSNAGQTDGCMGSDIRRLCIQSCEIKRLSPGPR